MEPFMKDANVTLAYTVDNKTYTKISSFTMTSPTMNYTWKVTMAGSFRIVVIWNGNENYNEAMSAPVIMNKT
jgi:hypothetical protein